MDQVSFQNGYVCGLATKGLVKSGQLYQPTIWNDSGVYTYFYIDFRRTLQEFTLGMFVESVLLNGNQVISITQVEQVSPTVCRVYCNIANMLHGITVVNKKTTRLRFSNGELLPVFSIHMFIEGQDKYLDGAYLCDKQHCISWKGTVVDTFGGVALAGSSRNSLSDTASTGSRWSGSTSDSLAITLT